MVDIRAKWAIEWDASRLVNELICTFGSAPSQGVQDQASALQIVTAHAMNAWICDAMRATTSAGTGWLTFNSAMEC